MLRGGTISLDTPLDLSKMLETVLTPKFLLGPGLLSISLDLIGST